MDHWREKTGRASQRKPEKMPELSQEVAEQMLSNIFEACDYEANLVPMEVLVSYTKYRRERHFLRWILLVLVVLFWMVPVLFVTPKAQLSLQQQKPGSPVVALETSSWLPIHQVSATVSGVRIPVYQMGSGSYQIVPDRNGLVTVRVTLANRQYTEVSCQVTEVDVDPPKLKGSRRRGELLDMCLEQDPGIDYENIYAVSLSGQRIVPVSWDQETCCVTFDHISTGMNIYVPDRCGNVLHLVLTLN